MFGEMGFKCWFRPCQTFYFTVLKVNLCEMKKMPLRNRPAAVKRLKKSGFNFPLAVVT